MSTPRSPRSDPLAGARAALADGALDEAVHLVGHGLRRDPDAREAYDLAARILEKRGGRGREGLLFRLCHDNFDDPRHFYELGFRFMAADLPAFARPILDRALRLDPLNPDVRAEYAVALAETGDHAGALEALAGVKRALFLDNPSLVFLDAWCRLLTGDAAGAAAGLAALDALRRAPKFDAALRERLHLGLERLRAAGRPGARDLRGWHFIQYGGALLSTSDVAGMGGRFGVLTERYEAVAVRLGALVAFVRAVEIPVRVVATAAGTDAEILGRAVAKRLGVPRKPVAAAGAAEAGTLLVAASGDDLAPMADLARRSAAPVVYAHRLAWTRSARFVPDIAGLAAEAHFFPWNRTLRMDPVDRKVVESPPDRRPPERIAAALAEQIPPAPPPDLARAFAFYARHRALSLFAGDARVTRRPPFRQESPVEGSRFA